jgi:hypothetical protein
MGSIIFLVCIFLVLYALDRDLAMDIARGLGALALVIACIVGVFAFGIVVFYTFLGHPG